VISAVQIGSLLKKLEIFSSFWGLWKWPLPDRPEPTKDFK
jgi:hypothetical protein